MTKTVYMYDQEEHFFSLCKPKVKKQIRQCLRCCKPFNSLHIGNRTCCDCQDIIRRSSKLSRSAAKSI